MTSTTPKINKRIPIFQHLEIETHSLCNRKCVWCIRNSNPDREIVSEWFTKNNLSFENIEKIIQQAVAMGYTGPVQLNHFNEVFIDKRFPEIAKMVKSYGYRILLGSNGDYLTKKLAQSIDGVVDQIGFALYYDGKKFEKRKKWILSLFKKTKVTVVCGADDIKYPIITHWNPIVKNPNAAKLSKIYQNNPCTRPLKRMIINHKGDMLMCCDDMVGHFNLGNIKDKTLEELWYSDTHQDKVIALTKRGGRSFPGNKHCLTCPRN